MLQTKMDRLETFNKDLSMHKTMIRRYHLFEGLGIRFGSILAANRHQKLGFRGSWSGLGGP